LRLYQARLRVVGRLLKPYANIILNLMKRSIVNTTILLTIGFSCGYLFKTFQASYEWNESKMNPADLLVMDTALSYEVSDVVGDDINETENEGEGKFEAFVTAQPSELTQKADPYGMFSDVLHERKDPAGAHAWLMANRDQVPHEEFESYLFEALVAWSATDPNAAEQYLGQLDDENYVYQIIEALATGWAEEDLTTAFEWLESPVFDNLPDRVVVQSYKNIMNKYAEVDPVGAAEAVAQLESEAVQIELMHPILKNYSEQNFNDALEWVLQLDAESVRSFGLGRLLTFHDGVEADAAMERILQSQSDLPISALVSAFKKLGFADMPASAEKLYRISDDKQPEVARALTSEWLLKDADGAVAWIQMQPENSPIYEAGAEVIFDSVSLEAPSSAIAWARRISDSEKRVQLVKGVINSVDAEELSDLEAAILRANFPPLEINDLLSAFNERVSEATAPLILPSRP